MHKKVHNGILRLLALCFIRCINGLVEMPLEIAVPLDYQSGQQTLDDTNLCSYDSHSSRQSLQTLCACIGGGSRALLLPSDNRLLTAVLSAFARSRAIPAFRPTTNGGAGSLSSTLTSQDPLPDDFRTVCNVTHLWTDTVGQDSLAHVQTLLRDAENYILPQKGPSCRKQQWAEGEAIRAHILKNTTSASESKTIDFMLRKEGIWKVRALLASFIILNDHKL
ncbi:unnamed protein product, partial [Mesorhabditis spiculigera]